MGEWSAILVDTNIFIKTNFNFNGGHLNRLKSFKDRPEQLIFDEIVCGEVVSRFSKELFSQSAQLKKATKQAFSSKLITNENKNFIESLCVSEKEAEEKAELILSRYIDDCGANVVDTSDYANLDDIIDDYFSCKPPFGVREIKKNEFPDALCLNSVLAWAMSENEKVVLVSEDKGWIEFSELHPDYLKVVKNIPEALNTFQDFDIREFYSEKVAQNWDDVCVTFMDSIQENLSSGLHGHTIDINVSSYLDFEYEVDEVFCHNIDFSNFEGYVNVNVIETPKSGFGGSFVVSIMAHVKYSVVVSLDFSVYDSIDKDYTHIGSNVEDAIFEDDVEIIATLKLSDVGLELLDFEVSGLPSSINMGEVEPDFS